MAEPGLADVVGGFDPALRIADVVDRSPRVQDLRVSGAVLPDLLLQERVHDTNTSANEAVNTRELLTALRWSVARRRGGLSR